MINTTYTLLQRIKKKGNTKTIPHNSEKHVFLGGKKIREMLEAGKKPPIEFSTPRVTKVLIVGMKE